MNEQEKDASDREAFQYEMKLHRDLAAKFAGTGTASLLLGGFLRSSLVLILILGVLAIVFYAKAWKHWSEARSVEMRTRT